MTALDLNTVIVSASQTVPWRTGRKPIVYTIKPRFVAKNEKGERQVFRYIDQAGQEQPLLIDRATIFDLNDEIQNHNYQMLLKNLEVDPELAAVIQVNDSVKEADDYVEKELKINGVISKLTAAYELKDFEKLRNIYRRKHLSATGVTDSMILKSLISLAKENHKEVESLIEDVNAEVVVLIDKAVEKNLLLRNVDVFSNTSGTVIAVGEKEMVYYLDQNPDFKATLQRLVQSAFESSKAPSKATHPMLVKPEDFLTGPITSDGGIPEAEVPNVETNLSKKDVAHIIKLGVKSKLLQDINGKYTVRGTEFSRAELTEYFESNLQEALQMKQELEANMLWVDPQ